MSGQETEVSLDQINEGHEDMRNGVIIRGVISWAAAIPIDQLSGVTHDRRLEVDLVKRGKV